MNSQSHAEYRLDDIEGVKTQLEIAGLKAKHLRLGDTKEWRAYAGMLTENFILDISEAGNIPVIYGRAAAVKQIRTSCEGAVTVHQAHTPEFELKNNEVFVTWAIHGRVVRGRDQPSYTLYGYHFDRWVRSGGAWKLAALRQKTLHLDVHVSAPVATSKCDA